MHPSQIRARVYYVKTSYKNINIATKKYLNMYDNIIWWEKMKINYRIKHFFFPDFLLFLFVPLFSFCKRWRTQYYQQCATWWVGFFILNGKASNICMRRNVIHITNNWIAWLNQAWHKSLIWHKELSAQIVCGGNSVCKYIIPKMR